MWLQNFKDPEGQLARWLEKLQQFDYTIVHWQGRSHINADALSRLPCSQCGRATHEQPCNTANILTIDGPPAIKTDDLRAAQLADPLLGPLLLGKESGRKHTPLDMGGASRYTRCLIQIWDQLQICRLYAQANNQQNHVQQVIPKNIAGGNPQHPARRYHWRPLGDRQDAKPPKRVFLPARPLWRCEKFVPNLRSLCLSEGTIHKISSAPNIYQNGIPTPNCSNGHHGAVPNFFQGKLVHTCGEWLFYSVGRSLRGSIGHYCSPQTDKQIFFALASPNSCTLTRATILSLMWYPKSAACWKLSKPEQPCITHSQTAWLSMSTVLSWVWWLTIQTNGRVISGASVRHIIAAYKPR